MIPIDFFTEISEDCANKPFALLPQEEQERYLSKLTTVVTALKEKLESRQLTETHGYHIVSEMMKALEREVFDEARFAEALSHLDEIYGPQTNPDLLKKVQHMDSFAEKFRSRAEEFSILESRATQEAAELTPEEIKIHDIEVLKKTGSFYIWEYTLILEQEMMKANDEGKRKLLVDGLNVESGNLPALKPLMKSFRQELAFHIYNRDVRWHILRIFFDFQEKLDTDNLKVVMKGLREFHIKLLTVAKKAGSTSFTGFVYKPYADGTPLGDIIGDLKK